MTITAHGSCFSPYPEQPEKWNEQAQFMTLPYFGETKPDNQYIITVSRYGEKGDKLANIPSKKGIWIFDYQNFIHDEKVDGPTKGKEGKDFIRVEVPDPSQCEDITGDTKTNPVEVTRTLLIQNIEWLHEIAKRLPSNSNPFFYSTVDCEIAMENHGIKDAKILGLLEQLRHANDKDSAKNSVSDGLQTDGGNKVCWTWESSKWRSTFLN